MANEANLSQPGQIAYVPRSTPNSWADGQHVLLGQDAVDFRLKVETVDPAEHTRSILIQHLPPSRLHIQLPAKWMQELTPAEQLNFVQVTRQQNDFVAEVGKETFDVRLLVDTRDGHMLSASMHNVVSLISRNCTDKDLKQCSPETVKSTTREITWKEVN